MTKIKNIAGYQFRQLTHLPVLREKLMSLAEQAGIKGTILLSEEGINLNMAGEPDAVATFQDLLAGLNEFDSFRFHETYSDTIPFKSLKIKIKPEIITWKQPNSSPSDVCLRAPSISPIDLKAWLDEGRDITLLDTRNDFEYRFGTFVGAINPHIESFGQLPEVIADLDRKKPVVMFCTGGIRCEKAAIYMQNHSFEEVYQLEGGILGYFRQVGGAHYEGECFVFDERIGVDPEMKVTGTAQCVGCRGPVYPEQQKELAFAQHALCAECVEHKLLDQDQHSAKGIAI